MNSFKPSNIAKLIKRITSAPSNERHFVRVAGNHVRVDVGVPFVLDINDGQVLVRAKRLLPYEGDYFKANGEVPWILYIEPGPDVSKLGVGTEFTLFICGRCFLVQVEEIRTQPKATSPHITTWDFMAQNNSPRPAVPSSLAPIQVVQSPASGLTANHGLHTPITPGVNAQGRKRHMSLTPSPLNSDLSRRSLAESLGLDTANKDDTPSYSASPKPLRAQSLKKSASGSTLPTMLTLKQFI